jgi:hypothetical protein
MEEYENMIDFIFTYIISLFIFLIDIIFIVFFMYKYLMNI